MSLTCAKCPCQTGTEPVWASRPGPHPPTAWRHGVDRTQRHRPRPLAQIPPSNPPPRTPKKPQRPLSPSAFLGHRTALSWLRKQPELHPGDMLGFSFLNFPALRVFESFGTFCFLPRFPAQTGVSLLISRGRRRTSFSEAPRFAVPGA